MKRFLNLNEFGAKALVVIGGVGVGVPALLYVLSAVLAAYHIRWEGLDLLTRGSCMLGGGLFLGLLALALIEQIQDRVIFKHYLKTRGKRIQGKGNTFECPYCGNRNVKAFEASCPVCGKALE